MKKIGLLFLTALLSLTLPACNDDDGDYPYVYGLITTVHTLGDKEYYFERDNGQTLYPSEKSATFEAEEGKRAVIYFDLLEGIPDYDYNIRLYRAEEIYTGPSAIVTTQEELDRQGGDAPGYTQGYYVSFDLTPIAAELEGKKGVILGIETCENGTKHIKLDLPQEQ